MSDLTLRQISFDCILKLLKKSFCQGLKNFFIDSRVLENKKLSQLLKSYFFNSQLNKLNKYLSKFIKFLLFIPLLKQNQMQYGDTKKKTKKKSYFNLITYQNINFYN